jgi:hypothetical protein
MNTDTILSKITSGIRTHCPANICYKTWPHSPQKFKKGHTCPLTTKQINRYTHPLNLLLKLVQKVSPTKPADAKIKKLNITPGYTSWLQRKTTEIGTVTLVKLQSVKFSIKINTKSVSG